VTQKQAEFLAGSSFLLMGCPLVGIQKQAEFLFAETLSVGSKIIVKCMHICLNVVFIILTK